ncbi:hypothetical protein SEVIR_4G122700v4 [Setaria viridis]|uniref:PGG domain-containing protein n=1 Tax=Setaria viridis TaxID=4556 RepID=A0A4U6V2G1_SETVI|nr:ankyrin repeat-containing protein NPR4-like [Setaria viridis]TKW21493.1 hypothetical protein SEVIR_4G122700v2 [Setaria viridis]
MEPSNHDKKANERVQDLTVVRRPELLRAASSGKLQLLQEFLSKEDGGSAAAAALAREVSIRLEEAQAPILYPSAAATEGASALHVVAVSGDKQGYLEVAEAICKKASQLLFTCDGNGDTPLHCAVRAGNAQMTSLLVGQADGCDQKKTMVRMQNKRGETALHEAVRFGHKTGMRMVEALMAEDKELARVVARDGTSALYLATSLHHNDIARQLIFQDEQLATSGPLGQNALHPAVLHSKKMTRALLKLNKDLLVRQQDLSGSTPMHFAASADDPSLEFFVYVFMERTLEFYSLGMYFAPQNWLIKLYRCLNLPLYQLVDADPSSAFQPDNDGLFPVHVAASAGNLVAVIILLIMCPGCAGLRDSQGRTFLHTAVEKRSHNIVKFVRMRPQFNSILNIQDNQGNTALHLAILEGHLCIFQTLIINPHVRLNLPNHEGKTPMDLAESKALPGFYFGMHAQRRIHGTLSFVNAQNGNCRRDRFKEKLVPKLNKDEESKKITEFAQIVGICSVLVATATFAAVFTMPGGFRTEDSAGDTKAPTAAPSPVGPIGTPILAGKYAFDGFVLANTLAFSCSTIATFSLVYCGMAAVDVEKRIKLVSISLALLNGAARSFCAAFAFALYLLLSPVALATAIATATMTALVLLDALRFLWLLFVDTVIVLNRRGGPAPLVKLTTAFIVNMVYLFWPYIIIFSLLGGRNKSPLNST